MAYSHELSSTFALELWLHAVASVQPFTTATQEPLTEVNPVKQLPSQSALLLAYVHEPSSLVAVSLKLHAN